MIVTMKFSFQVRVSSTLWGFINVYLNVLNFF